MRVQKVKTAACLATLMILSLSSAAMAQVTISILTAEPEGSFDAAIAGFEAANPDIKVDFQTVPFESMVPTIESRLGTKDASLDVFLVDTPRLPALARDGYLIDLSNRLQAVHAVASEAAQSVLMYDNKLYAPPLWTSTQLMYYNKDLFDAAGIPYPSSDENARMTYEQTIALAQKVIAGSTAKYVFVPEQIDRYYQLQPIFQGNGGGSGLTGEGNLTPDVANAKWIEAGKFYASLFEQGLAPRGIGSDQMPSVFSSGETVFYRTGPWRLRDFAKAGSVRFGLARCPIGRAASPKRRPIHGPCPSAPIPGIRWKH